MGRGAMAAHQTLDLWILVRAQAPQLDFLSGEMADAFF